MKSLLTALALIVLLIGGTMGTVMLITMPVYACTDDCNE